MSELTRDEIREACEAVGWEWSEDEDAAFEATTSYNFPRFDGILGGDEEKDALALLEAWCSVHPDREVQLFINRDKPGLILIPEEGIDYAIPADGPLRTAAIRAVNQWAERKEST